MSLTLQDIFDQLMAGEFSQLSVGGQDAGTINAANYKQAVAHVNLALSALYRRFFLKEGRYTLTPVSGSVSYTLPMGDLNKVERVLTDRELELPLNDASDVLSCFTPSMNVLVVPSCIPDPTNETPSYLRTASLSVVYRANHPLIHVVDGFDPTQVNIELPYSHLEALLYFVAARTQAPVGLNNEFNAASRYAAKYEQACQELMQVNLRVDSGNGNQRLYQKGFV